MFTLAATASRAAVARAEKIVREDLYEEARRVQSYTARSIEAAPPVLRVRKQALRNATLATFRASAADRVRDVGATALRAYWVGWRRRHRWRLALVRVRAFLAMRSLLEDVYAPGGAGWKRARLSYRKAGAAASPLRPHAP